jgi:hypothetical protein
MFESPPYFQLGDETDSADLRIPASILDIFYLRTTVHTPAYLAVVVGCMGGYLDIFIGDAIRQLPELLYGQVQAIQTSRRDQFRILTAQSLGLFTLDAMEQAVQIAGFNDAVYLFGWMQMRIESVNGRLDKQPLQINGRLDLLHTFRQSAAHVFTDPHNPNEKMYHLLIPAGPASDIQQGKHLVLLYPILDPQLFERAHNSFIVMRLAYDLLLALQQDMLQAGSPHPFVRQPLPVPSRKRLEEELKRDGYEVKGDVAIKKFQVQPQLGQIRFLMRLRQVAQRWVGERIALPPQAMSTDYQKLIDHLLKDIATTADKRMMAAMKGRVRYQTAVSSPKPAQPDTQPSVKDADWKNDFES